jgi:hypothetical protein
MSLDENNARCSFFDSLCEKVIVFRRTIDTSVITTILAQTLSF